MILKIFLTWFGCGYFPKAPGTMGSIGALPLCWLSVQYGTTLSRILFALLFTALAIIAAAKEQRINKNSRDPGYIVVDEVAGMLWSVLFLTPHFVSMLCAFLLFRVLDIFKPFPANILDRRSKNFPTAYGRGLYIVLDDVASGLWVSAGFLCFQLILKRFV